jgi:hypothetical protein
MSEQKPPPGTYYGGAAVGYLPLPKGWPEKPGTPPPAKPVRPRPPRFQPPQPLGRRGRAPVKLHTAAPRTLRARIAAPLRSK